MKAPWTLCPGWSTHCATDILNAEGRMIASVWCHGDDTEGRDRTAALIAAAPELLAALEALLEASFLFKVDAYGHQLDNAHAAVAKALGNKTSQP